MKKRVLSLLLAMLMLIMLLAGCSSSSSSQPAPAAPADSTPSDGGNDEPAGQPVLDTSEQVEIIMYYLGTEPAGQQVIWDQLNEMLLAELNCTLKVNFISFADYPNKYPLLFGSGEELDIAYTASWLNYPSLAKSGAFMELDELWPTYAPNNYALASDTAKKQAMLDGVTYCIPSLNRTYSAYGPIYRMDLVKDLGFDKEIQNFEDMEEYLTLIKENYPEMQPLSLYSMGSEVDDIFMYYNKMYPVKGAQNDFLWIDPSEANPQIFTYYEYDKTPEFLEMMNRWNEKGLFPKSALSDTDSAKFKNGVSPLVVHNVDNFVSDAISNPEWDVHYANFVSDISNLSFTQDAMVIANNSKHPERALALWDYLTTNEEAFMLFYYGIEGVSYELNDKGEITMIDTDNYNTSSMWAVRNSDYMHNGAGTPEAYDQLKQEWDSTIQDGKGAQSFRSFVVDTSSIQTEYDACVSTHQQYWWPLELGYTDPVSGLAEYQKMMEAAGIEKVREEIQRQLDEYLASMK